MLANFLVFKKAFFSWNYITASFELKHALLEEGERILDPEVNSVQKAQEASQA